MSTIYGALFCSIFFRSWLFFAKIKAFHFFRECMFSFVNEVKEKLFCVRGNCDTEVDQMVLDFPIMADYAVIPCGNRIIYATHGHHHNVMTPIPMQPGDILLHGHTHVPAWEPFGNENLYLNPGSVSIPKENSAHSYMILEDGIAKWKNLYGEVYHELML